MPPQALYDLGLVPRLRWLELFAPCKTDEHQAYTPYYMFSLLSTVAVRQSKIQDLTFNFEIESEDNGGEVAPMEFNELPKAFKQDVWRAIKAVLTQLMAHHTFNISLNVTVLVITEDEVSPDVSRSLLRVLDDWARRNLHEDTQTDVEVIET